MDLPLRSRLALIADPVAAKTSDGSSALRARERLIMEKRHKQPRPRDHFSEAKAEGSPQHDAAHRHGAAAAEPHVCLVGAARSGHRY
jgi:hypothetical protein